jgi:hypothetical protein
MSVELVDSLRNQRSWSAGDLAERLGLVATRTLLRGPASDATEEDDTVGSEWRREAAVQLSIEAPPAAVYGRIVDLVSVGRRSLECRRATWLVGAPPGQVGSRFRGHNRAGWVRWSRVSEVIEAEPPWRFTFRTVPQRLDPTRADSTRWTYTIEPLDGGGSLVTHAYRIEKLPLQPFRWALGGLMPHHRDMRPHLRYTLEALRAELEDEPRRSPPDGPARRGGRDGPRELS